MSVTRVICRQQLGDLLLHQPAIEWLARKGPVIVSTREAHAPLVGLMPGVKVGSSLAPEATVCFDAKPASLLHALWPLRQTRTLVIPEKRINPLHRWLFNPVIPFAKGSRYTALALFLATGGQSDAFHPPRLLPPPDEWRPAQLPPRYVLIHPTSAWQRKCLTPAHWAKGLSKQHLTQPIVITGGNAPWEAALSEALTEALVAEGFNAINLAGKTSLRGYISTAAHADAVLCVDGSASHLAAAFRRPCLTLFGPTNPTHWHWPTEYSLRLWAADHVDTPYPATALIPVDALREAISRLLTLCPS